MSGTQEQGSEVARLLQQIRAEFEAAQRGLSGLAQVGKHQFITTKMENMGKYHDELREIVGDDAMGLIVQVLGDFPGTVSPPPP